MTAPATTVSMRWLELLAGAVGIDPHYVHSLHVEESIATFIVYRLDAAGELIRTASGDVLTETYEIEVVHP